MTNVRFGLQLWPQATTWPEVRDAAIAAEAAGWDSIWTWDHLLAIQGPWQQPIYEGWTFLAGLASLTSRVRLGLMVGANTFRNPGLTTKLATTLDHVSNGRAVLGIGGAWFDREHEAFGIDFGKSPGERLDWLGEAVPLMRRLLDGELVTHEGRFYTFTDALCEPRPIQSRLPILIGGSGREKTLRTTARHADLWNGYGEPARIAETSEVLRQRCEEIGRPFEAIERTVTMEVVIRASESDAREAYEVVEDRHGIRGRIGSDGTPRGLNAAGPPEVVADYVRQYERLGIAEVIWIFRNPFDLESMSRLDEVRALLA